LLILPHAGFANILTRYTIPTYPAMSSFLHTAFNRSRPDLLICDFLVDACADVADTLGLKYAISMSGLPPGGEHEAAFFCVAEVFDTTEISGSLQALEQ
jgi:hypothetical protein